MSGLQYNPSTGEPYLRLPAPFSNIILTPPRMTDVDESVAILSDPEVAKWLGPTGPGSTYTTEKAQGWLTQLTAKTDEMVKELGGSTEPHPVSGCPLRHIRQVGAEGTERFLGDINITRSSFIEVPDVEERARLVAENNARVAGDPEISWMVSAPNFLAPSHQGRGLTTVALRTLITQFGVPWMKTKRIRPATFEDNHGSIKVLQKSGFVVIEKIRQEGLDKSGYLFEWRGFE
ncbi:Acetyltransferase, GNAT family [Favolaschia claudopus]|uniref:Acetyltransferase, GNAT family n=1 Tax=Favolaschia claudopus TaxID=2862362 RepID=A0AAW0C3Y3_9AGAR